MEMGKNIGPPVFFYKKRQWHKFSLSLEGVSQPSGCNEPAAVMTVGLKQTVFSPRDCFYCRSIPWFTAHIKTNIRNK